ncbi:alpha/beta fold hydrolase [Streptosporangium sp. NPDC004379]|uniref:alpha/beta fold hydrolase n=1 Tax=Streptosporangium sp. NPDC004379 TaxID=3366189 RepID=UPI0036C64795
MEIRNLVIAAALTSTHLPGVPATVTTGTPTATAEPLHGCARATARCDGEISVPLDWNDPSSERITVAFAWLPRAGASGTVLANPGGPAAALPDVPALTEVLGPVLDRRNLLVVEPRGLGKSSPLLCPDLDLGVPETIAGCAERLGPRLRYFTADQAVDDMDAVRRALGVPKVTFHGTSYGTLFAQAYATRHPGSTAALFLDSTVTTNRDGYASWPLRARLDLLDLVCRASRDCRSLPGTAGGTWTRLVERLRARPDPKAPPTGLAAVVANVSQPVFGREAGAAATAYLRGDPAPLHRLVTAVTAGPVPPLKGSQWAGYLAYRCGDSALPFDRDASPAERREQLDRHYREKRPLRPFTVAELGGTSPLDLCVNWPTPRPSPPVPPDAAYPAVPVLAVGGDFDTETPAEVAEQVRRFPRGVFVRVPFGGHSLAWGSRPVNECVRSLMRSFLDDPSRPLPAARCTAENYRATGEFPETVKEATPIRAPGLSARDRRVAGAAFATVQDASARRNPYSLLHSLLKTEPGLRGGRLAFDDAARAISLEDVRFVGNLAVSGRVTLPEDPDGGGEAVARLTVTGDDGTPHEITLSWPVFVAEERPPLSGTFDGRPFSS